VNKLELFKLRASQHGQSITLYSFLANPSGTYVDANSGYPDPESPTYPATVPGVSYATTPLTVLGFVQPPTAGTVQGQRYHKTVAGEDIEIDLVAYLPGDQAVTVRDKLVVSAVNYAVVQIKDFSDGATMVMRECWLRKMVG